MTMSNAAYTPACVSPARGAGVERLRRRSLSILRSAGAYDWNQFIVGVCAGIIAAAAWVSNFTPADHVAPRLAADDRASFIVVPLSTESLTR